MKQQLERKIDLTWVMYLGYTILLACSFNLLPEGFITPSVWMVTIMLFIINLFLSLGLIMAWYALGKIKANPQAIKITLDRKQQKKFAWALLLEVIIIYLLMTSSLAKEVNFIMTLVVTKIVLTVAFLTIHRQIRKYIPKN